MSRLELRIIAVILDYSSRRSTKHLPDKRIEWLPCERWTRMRISKSSWKVEKWKVEQRGRLAGAEPGSKTSWDGPVMLGACSPSFRHLRAARKGFRVVPRPLSDLYLRCAGLWGFCSGRTNPRPCSRRSPWCTSASKPCMKRYSFCRCLEWEVYKFVWS